MVKDYIPCYMIDLRTGDKYDFECPDSVSESVSANYDMQSIIGRAGSVRGYNNTTDKSYSFTLLLNDDLCPKGIVQTVAFIQSQLYPEYKSMIIPPKTMLRIGHIMSARCVLTGCDVTWKKPYRDGHYINAEVAITIETSDEVPPSASEILTSSAAVQDTSSYYVAMGKATNNSTVSTRLATGIQQNKKGKWEVI